MVASHHIYGPEARDLTDAPGHPPFPDHGYEEDHTGWADDDYPNATHFKLYDTGYYDGWPDKPTKVRFGAAWVKDKHSKHKTVDYAWQCVHVNGVDDVRSINSNTRWEYDDFTSQNDEAQYIQYVVLHSDVTCIYHSSSVEHWSIWNAQ